MLAETPGIGIVGILFLPIRGLLVADGIFSSRFFGNLNCSLTINGCVFSLDMSLKVLSPSGDSCVLILCLAKLAADIFLADLAFSLTDELEEDELEEDIPRSSDFKLVPVK